VPWVLLSAGEAFDAFQRLTGLACQEGASGFMVGRAIWQEAMNLADPAERDRFLATTGASRLRILTAVADAYATPWTARFDDAARGVAAREDWHVRYEA
jgi:tagatose 1,6-diphosphate aldolase